jgi:hypothetical protein
MLLPDKGGPQLPNSSFDLLADRKWNESGLQFMLESDIREMTAKGTIEMTTVSRLEQIYCSGLSCR